MSRQGLSNKQRAYHTVDRMKQVRYNRNSKQTRRRIISNYTKHKDNIMQEEKLLYDKYGYWSEGEWVPYDDMEATWVCP